MTGMTWRSMITDGMAMRHGKDLTWSQVVMAANTPMLLRAGLVDGNTDAGVLASGQVAGILDDLPSCAELIDTIVADAIKHLQSASALRSIVGPLCTERAVGPVGTVRCETPRRARTAS